MEKTADNPTDLCQECRINKFKYKCPGCSRRTCSLTCVNSHKKNSGCFGKRDVTAFVPLSQFDDSTLLSDYKLLEEMKRVAESARRTNMQSHEYRLRYLRDAATRRRTKLLFFPAGMSRQKNNQTCYINKFELIKWTIEWRFHSTSVNLLEHQVRESLTLRSIIEKHLQPSPWRNKLRRFTEEPIDILKFYICKDQKDRRSPYRELDIDTPLRKLFSGLVILEYPVIHVFLPSDPCNFKVIKVVKPIPTQLKSEEPVKDETDDTSIHASITSKEEEIIEDEEAPEPLIVDFLEADMSMASSPWGHATEGDEPLSSTVAELMEASIDDFDFDQEMMAYSLLNPDEFLDYKPEGEAAVSSLAGLDGLEEGEIPGCD